MSDIPHDFVAFVPDWSKAMRFQKQAPDCWIQRVWDGAWRFPKEYGDACVAKVYDTADLIMVPAEFNEFHQRHEEIGNAVEKVFGSAATLTEHIQQQTGIVKR